MIFNAFALLYIVTEVCDLFSIIQSVFQIVWDSQKLEHRISAVVKTHRNGFI